MREQAVLTMENLKKTLAAAGCTFADLVSATRFLTDVAEQDDLNGVWAAYLDGHLPTTTTVEVSRLATHARASSRSARLLWRRGERLMARSGSSASARWGPDGQAAARRRRPVVGYNRTPEKARALVAAGLVLEKSPRASPSLGSRLQHGDRQRALRAIALGPDGVIAGLRPGAVWAEMSTVSPDVTRELGQAVAARVPR